MQPGPTAAMAESVLQAARPRIVIVGAGMSGLAAARRLQQHRQASAADPTGRFELIVLEGGDRIGGRVCTTTFAGERVELGATWIHGVDGSPVHAIATAAGAFQTDALDGRGRRAWLEDASVRLEGGAVVDRSVVDEMTAVYKGLLRQAQEAGALRSNGATLRGGSQEEAAEAKTHTQVVSEDLLGGGSSAAANGGEPATAPTAPEPRREHTESVGEFLRCGLEKYLKGLEAGSDGDLAAAKAIRRGVFAMRQNLERGITAADSLDDLSLPWYHEYHEVPGEHVTIPGGYSAVPAWLAAQLPAGAIHLNHRVRCIRWQRPVGEGLLPVLVECDGGAAFAADHRIVTVSLGVLKAEASGLFDPLLPRWKLDAITRMGFGIVDKVFLDVASAASQPMVQFVFDKPSSVPSPTLSPTVPTWMRRTFGVYPMYSETTVLVMWLAGAEALQMEREPPLSVGAGIAAALRRFGYDKIAPGSGDSALGTPPSVLRSQWGLNPLFRGSYSYVAVASSGHDLERLAEPLGYSSAGQQVKPASNTPAESISPGRAQLCFAGEATHRHFYSTTHGAYLSSIREAEHLLKLYSWLKPKGIIPYKMLLVNKQAASTLLVNHLLRAGIWGACCKWSQRRSCCCWKGEGHEVGSMSSPQGLPAPKAQTSDLGDFRNSNGSGCVCVVVLEALESPGDLPITLLQKWTT
eukprot:SM000037S13588  [mRNA]  locus=s37:697285:703226:- [translate_table: standard]